MNYKESLIFQKPISHSDKCLNQQMYELEACGRYSPPQFPFQGTVYGNQEKHSIVRKRNPAQFSEPSAGNIACFISRD